MVPGNPLQAHLLHLGLPGALVAGIVDRFRARTIPRHGTFVQAGDVDNRLGFVLSGVFSMEVIQGDGRLFIKDFLGPGTFLLGSFDPRQENLVTLRALRCAKVLEARHSDILDLQAGHPAFGALARRSLERRFEALSQRLERLAGLDAQEGYAQFRSDFRTLERDIPLHLVAAYLNITPTQLSRIRRQSRDST